MPEHQKLGCGNRNRDRECVGANQAAITIAPQSTQAAQETEVAEQADGAKNQADRKGCINDQFWTQGHGISPSGEKKYCRFALRHAVYITRGLQPSTARKI